MNMHKKFRLIFWSEIILAFLFLFIRFSFLLADATFYFRRIRDTSTFNEFMYNAVSGLSSVCFDIEEFIWPFVNLLFVLALIFFPLVIYNAPVKYYKTCKSTPETPKAGTYWWKLCISGGLLVIGLIVHAQTILNAWMGV